MTNTLANAIDNPEHNNPQPAAKTGTTLMAEGLDAAMNAWQRPTTTPDTPTKQQPPHTGPTDEQLAAQAMIKTRDQEILGRS